MSTSAAASDVSPSTTKSSGKEIVASNPPTAGPMLIPRFTASRLSGDGRFALLGRSRAVSADIVAGRVASATSGPHEHEQRRMTPKAVRERDHHAGARDP